MEPWEFVKDETWKSLQNQLVLAREALERAREDAVEHFNEPLYVQAVRDAAKIVTDLDVKLRIWEAMLRARNDS